uniref:Uncharacterized protein n=1 Tax=Setaria viridis TaxID=4556 RepID=A0A4U6V2F4_SETVI|nr:hypothetical protein SEVIR_4G280501v2 [Setaria viridis]
MAGHVWLRIQDRLRYRDAYEYVQGCSEDDSARGQNGSVTRSGGRAEGPCGWTSRALSSTTSVHGLAQSSSGFVSPSPSPFALAHAKSFSAGSPLFLVLLLVWAPGIRVGKNTFAGVRG